MSKKNTKAARTARARREFRNRYGNDTYNVVRWLVKGKTSGEVATRTGVSVGSVAAIRANLTRGTYDEVLTGCNL